MTVPALGRDTHLVRQDAGVTHVSGAQRHADLPRLSLVVSKTSRDDPAAAEHAVAVELEPCGPTSGQGGYLKWIPGHKKGLLSR